MVNVHRLLLPQLAEAEHTSLWLCRSVFLLNAGDSNVAYCTRAVLVEAVAFFWWRWLRDDLFTCYVAYLSVSALHGGTGLIVVFMLLRLLCLQ